MYARDFFCQMCQFLHIFFEYMHTHVRKIEFVRHVRQQLTAHEVNSLFLFNILLKLRVGNNRLCSRRDIYDGIYF